MNEKTGQWRKNILLVDDEEIIRCTLRRDIEEMGYGATALVHWKTEEYALKEKFFNLVRTDVCME